METITALSIYLLSAIAVLLSIKHVNSAGRIFFFFILFYSISPLFQFESFYFFSYEVSYRWDPLVFLIYALVLFASASAGLFLFSIRTQEVGILALYNNHGLKVLWIISLTAWLIDIYFNWTFFLLPKHEYIASIPHQTKNLFLFTIPAKEILAGAAIFSPFKGRAKAICVIVGLLAVLHSLALGVRHIALILLLMALVPRLRGTGILFLCLGLTFVGEISNAVKLFLSPASGLQAAILDGNWWLDFFSANFGVSSEQKAILSNLLLKIRHPELLELGRGVSDIFRAIPGGSALTDIFGLSKENSTSTLGDFVGVLEGQGTAYSLHLSIIESFGFVIPFIVMTLLVANFTRGSMLFIVAGEIIYSMMRNGADYWLTQTNKLIFLVVVTIALSRLTQEILRILRMQSSSSIHKPLITECSQVSSSYFTHAVKH